MKIVRYIERRAGGYTGLVLREVSDGQMYITVAVDASSKSDVSRALDAGMEATEPLARVQLDWQPTRIVVHWALRVGAEHLVALLAEAVERCPERRRRSAGAVVDDHRYSITRTDDGIRIDGENLGELWLRGPLVTRANGQRWLHLRGITQPRRNR